MLIRDMDGQVVCVCHPFCDKRVREEAHDESFPTQSFSSSRPFVLTVFFASFEDRVSFFFWEAIHVSIACLEKESESRIRERDWAFIRSADQCVWGTRDTLQRDSGNLVVAVLLKCSSC